MNFTFFPYLGENTVIFDALINDRIVSYVTIPECDYDRCDSGEVLLLEKTGITIHSNFDLSMEISDGVIFSEKISEPHIFKLILPYLKKAVDLNKTIICAAKLTNQQHSIFVAIAKKILYLPNLIISQNIEYEKDILGMPIISTINTPVIMIGGVVWFFR